MCLRLRDAARISIRIFGMLITRKIGSFVRGSATPFQVYAACLLGVFLGFLPGFGQAPALMVFWSVLLLTLNANLFLAGLATLFGKALFLLALPVWFHLGRLLLEGPLEGLFRSLVNAPVTAFAGLDYYAVAGGQLAALPVGLTLGFLLNRALRGYRLKMVELSKNSERLQKWSSKGSVKAMSWIFLGGKSKVGYEELLNKKVGNPVRVWGVALVAIVLLGSYLGLNWLSGPMAAQMVRGELERLNGATVDLESIDLKLEEGRIEMRGLAMADPAALETNLFEATTLTADVSAADLLRKRLSIDRLTFADAAVGTARPQPGVIVGTPREPSQGLELPDFDDLGSVLENADQWKERLSQVKRWLEDLSSAEAADEAEEAALSWKEELDRRIRSEGYARVRADFLTVGSPTLLIRSVEALGVRSSQPAGPTFDVTGTNRATHLLAEDPRIAIQASDGSVSGNLSLDASSGARTGKLDLRLAGLEVDAYASSLAKDGGEPPIHGGSMNVALGGSFGLADSDLVAQVSFLGTQGKIGGSPVSLDGVTLPINLRGPIDNPQVKLESKALEKVLVSAGKKKLLDKAAKKLGEDEKLGGALQGLLGGSEKKPAEGEGDAGSAPKQDDSEEQAKQLLKGLFK